MESSDKTKEYKYGFIIWHSEYMENHNFLYVNYENTMLYNMIMGFIIGFAYALFELPNSFIKRRLDIQPGSSLASRKILKYIFE